MNNYSVEVVFINDRGNYQGIRIPVVARSFADARAIATEQIGAAVVSINTQKLSGGQAA